MKAYDLRASAKLRKKPMLYAMQESGVESPQAGPRRIAPGSQFGLRADLEGNEPSEGMTEFQAVASGP